MTLPPLIVSAWRRLGFGRARALRAARRARLARQGIGIPAMSRGRDMDAMSRPRDMGDMSRGRDVQDAARGRDPHGAVRLGGVGEDLRWRDMDRDVRSRDGRDGGAGLRAREGAADAAPDFPGSGDEGGGDVRALGGPARLSRARGVWASGAGRVVRAGVVLSTRGWRHLRRSARDPLARRRLVSPLMRRILLVNALPLAILALTLLFLNDFQNSLLESDVGALREQAHIYAGALGQDAVVRARGGVRPDGGVFEIDPDRARPLLSSLTEPSPNARALLVGPDGRVIADSRADVPATHTPRRGRRAGAGAQTAGSVGDFPERDDGAQAWSPPRDNAVEVVYDWLLSLLPLASRTGIVTLDAPDDVPQLPRGAGEGAAAVGNVAGSSETPPYIRRTRAHQLVITVVEPVIHDNETVGIIQLTRAAAEVDRSLFSVRSSILSLFLMAMAVTVFLSWYLSLTIARPLRRLAVSTQGIRDGAGRADSVPERLLARRDEIGELGRSLRASALALWSRMDANERFAADVAHEIKNPLSSIRSAIETLPRIENPDARSRLLGIIHSDVRRLDRLITDISDASRVDAELSRTKAEPVAVAGLLSILVDIHQTTRKGPEPALRLALGEEAPGLFVWAVEDRLVQVLRNLIGNAISFSPAEGEIVLSARGDGAMVELAVSDEGPGIPEGKLETIFDRFYSERPNTEKFGQHSGLGLAISRQIIEALRGTLQARNRVDADGRVLGARFVVRLPRAGR